MNGQCKYYNKHMDTILAYISCLYDIEGCECGGNLHILLDDDNYDRDSILFCLDRCITHPEDEESELGILICKEYLKLSLEERAVLDSMWNIDRSGDCIGTGDCEKCIRLGELYESMKESER